MDIFKLYRSFWDWCFENPEKIKPNHIAIYCFAIEHCNRLGWKNKFGFPTSMAMDAVGIKNYKTYINALNDLVDFGFLDMIEKSKNQYSSNIIAIVNFTKASTKALDKASLKHSTKQVQSIASINKPIYKETNIPITDLEKSVPKELTLRQSIIHYWLKEFHIGWTFEDIHGKKINSIINKLRKISSHSKDGGTDQYILDLFISMCERLPDYYKDKDLQIIDSKFNEIIEEIKNGKRTSNNKQKSMFAE